MAMLELSKGGKSKSRAKPTLVQIGNRTIISSGQYHIPTVADYLLPRSLPHKGAPRGRWIGMGEIASLRGTGADPTAKKRARKILPKLSAHLLDECSRVLIYEYEGRRVSRVKVYDPTSATEDERQEAIYKLDQMKNRADLSIDRYEKAFSLIGPSVHPSTNEQQSSPQGEVVDRTG